MFVMGNRGGSDLSFRFESGSVAFYLHYIFQEIIKCYSREGTHSVLGLIRRIHAPVICSPSAYFFRVSLKREN